MSDNIRLDVRYTDGRGLVDDPHVTITPDIARQIEALARDASEEQQFPPEARIAPSKRCVELENAALRARVAELEKELATAVDGRAVHLKSHNEAVAERDRALTDLALANEDCREKQAAIEKFLSGEQAADAEIARLNAELAVLKRKYNES